MCATKGNYAFVDGNNLYLSTKGLGWKLDHNKFRIYLKDKFNASIAYYFIGYKKDNQKLYDSLERSGFKLVYKDVAHDDKANVKGNIDAELVLHAMIDIEEYDQAIIVSSDGDFACLVEYLVQKGKLKRVLAASKGGCSNLLSKAAGTNIDYLDNLRDKLEYKK